MFRNKIKSFDKNNKATSKKIFWYKKEVNDNLIMNLENKKNENKKEQISKLSPLVFNETDWIFATPSINFDLDKDEVEKYNVGNILLRLKLLYAVFSSIVMK